MVRHVQPLISLATIVGVATAWYCFVYPYSTKMVSQYERIIRAEEKNIQGITALEQQSKSCLKATGSLETDYFVCMNENRTACSDDGMITMIMDGLEKNQLQLNQFQLKHKEKKEWHSLCRATLSFEGHILHVMQFFKTVGLHKNSFIPTDFTLKVDDIDRVHVTTTITWIRCSKG